MFDFSQLSVKLNKVFNNNKDDSNSAIINKIKSDMLPFYLNLYEKIVTDNFSGIYLIKGGRQSSKTYGITQLMLLLSYHNNFDGLNFVNMRKNQVGIENSVYSVYLSHQRDYDIYTPSNVTKRYMNIGGVRHLFVGCRHMQDALNLKGINDVGAYFIEEAEGFDLDALEVLHSTYRRRDKKPVLVFIALNPYSQIDDVIQFYSRYKNYNEYHINIFDLPEYAQDPTALEQAEADKRYSVDHYNWKWLGRPYPAGEIEPFKNINKVTEFKSSGKVWAFLDPAFIGGKDTTALSICSLLGDDIYIYGICYIGNWHNSMNSIIEQLHNFNVDYFYYENNSIGDLPSDLFYNRGVIATPYNNSPSKGSKMGRIANITPLLKNLQFVVSAEDEQNKIYIKQILNYNTDKTMKNYSGNNYKDDAPDSLASCLKQMGIN